MKGGHIYMSEGRAHPILTHLVCADEIEVHSHSYFMNE